MSIKQIIKYFFIYKKYTGWRILIVFFLTLFSAVTEGFGIFLLFPLLESADIGVEKQNVVDSEVQKMLYIMLDALGIRSSLIGILVFIAIIFLLKGCISFFSFAYQSNLKAQLLSEIKTLMFDKYCKMDYQYFIKQNTGHFVTIINSQITTFVSSFDSYVLFLAIVTTTSVYIFLAFLLTSSFALMAVIAGLILLFLFRRLNTHVHSLSRKAAKEKSTLNKHLVQTIQSFKYLASTAQLKFLKVGLIESIQRLSIYMRRLGIAQGLTRALSEPITIFFILLVVVIQVSFIKTPLASIFVALVLFNRAMGGILGIQQAWQSILTNAGALEVVESEFLELKNKTEANGSIKLKPLQTEIEFRNLSFNYEGRDEIVLNQINLKIPANTTVAFVGESGAGKSTLVDLITLMLRPTLGDIVVNGIKSSDIDLYSWRCQIGYVAQETVVFDDTIANNICLWKEDYNDDSYARSRIEIAAKHAYADGFIDSLPEKYNSVVGDRGVKLSGGQRQRLFLARELYKNPRLLILDEATSALDSESEKFIQDSIKSLKGKTTVIIIAHRLSTIKDADCIYVLEKGEIVEYGTYDGLLELGESGCFRKMVSLQSL